VLGVLVRRYHDFETCEDAVQEALLAAALHWSSQGVPDNPTGWLITVAARRWLEVWRRDVARRRREAAACTPRASAADAVLAADGVDNTLILLLLCCHPSLSLPSQVALTLRAVGGLTTEEIARAFLVPVPTIAQRISRAKQRIKAAGAVFRLPPPAELMERVTAVLAVLYLIFNEGYTASSGSQLVRVDLTSEAVRLTRQLYGQLSENGEVAGLLALMLLTDARRPARTRSDGTLVPLADQDRGHWDAQAITEGVALITAALAAAPVGPYQLQAAIAAVHAEAPRYADTDWPQILGLYELLDSSAPGPMVTLNRIIAAAMVHGPDYGLTQLRAAEADPALAGHYRVAAVRAHLLESAGDDHAARAHYLQAARRTLSLPEQRYLESRAATLKDAAPALPATDPGSTANP